MDIEELLLKLGFRQCGDTPIYQIGLSSAMQVHLEQAKAMTPDELKDFIGTQLECVRVGINSHIDGTLLHLNKLTNKNLAKYGDFN